MVFKKFREKRLERLIDKINRRNFFKRYAMLLSGCLIMAFTFIRCRDVETRKKLAVFIMIFEVIIILGLQFIYQDIAFIGLGAT